MEVVRHDTGATVRPLIHQLLRGRFTVTGDPFRTMYATCLYCSGALGANTAVEAFPVGRQLAFDANAGRLWVVCARCGRWNLTPLEERWEAIEQCERLFRAIPTKASTEQIGLAALREGLSLVRIGAPTRPEFAAWRYGREFAARRRRAWSLAGVTAVAAFGSLALREVNPALYGAIPMIGLLHSLPNYWNLYRMTLKPVARITATDGSTVTLRGNDTSHISVESLDGDTSSWQLNVLHGRGRTRLTGAEAERVLGRVMHHVNMVGDKPSVVDDAVRQLVDAGSSAAFIRQFGAQHGKRSWREEAPARRIALEMAVHESTERAALEGELAALETAWREAEEIAAIADSLIVPAWISSRLSR